MASHRSPPRARANGRATGRTSSTLICRQAALTDEQVVAKFKAAMAGKTGAWRAAADRDPLAMFGEEKQDGSFIVHQPGKKVEGRDVANTFDDPSYRGWLSVDAAKSPGLHTYPWAAKWLSAFKARYITSQARTTDTTRQTRKDAFKDRNRQQADESARDHLYRVTRREGD